MSSKGFWGFGVLGLAPAGDVFIRGDLDNNSTVDLVDALLVAAYLFSGGATPDCLDAADSNDDGFIDLSDTLYIIIFQFLSGPAPEAPFPAPGLDPTFLDGLPC